MPILHLLHHVLLLCVIILPSSSAFSILAANPTKNTPSSSPSSSCRHFSSPSVDNDLWDANASPLQQEWASSLPLPENAQHPNDDPTRATRARHAMAGPHPPALEGRCTVNLNAFNDRLQWLHVDPPVLIIDDFLSSQECSEALACTNESPPPHVGRVIKLESRLSDSNKSRSSSTALRLSTTWYVRYAAPPLKPLLRGLLELLPNVALEQVEEVQLVRYEGEGQGFGWHEDVLDVDSATPEAGGQRVATLLVYLDECEDGRTLFRDLRGKDNKRLGVSPKKGRALLFFPAMTTSSTALSESATLADEQNTQQHPQRPTFGEVYFDETRADHRTTHAGEPPTGSKNNGQKHIAQMWIHSGEHTPVVFGRGLNKHAEARL